MDSISTLNALKAVQASLSQAAPGAQQFVMLFNADGTPAGKYPAQQLVQDMAKAGNAIGTCSTAAATAAKTVAVSDFILLKNGIVSVYFTSANSAAGATLNVNSTGAKPIRINGTAVQPGVIKSHTIVQMQYDGTAWNIVGMLGLEQSLTPDSLVVDMGLPSGVLWAKANIDLTQANKFAASPYQYECSFVSWGNTEMFNPSSASAFDHNWGTGNDTEPYVSSPGAALTGNMAPSQDAARANLGAPWRMPTTEEFAELFANIDYLNADGAVIDAATADKRCNYNGVMGLRLRSKINGKEIFFVCSGYGDGTSWNHRGSIGYYWSASLYSATGGRNLHFGSGGVYPQDYSSRFLGFAVRPVQ